MCVQRHLILILAIVAPVSSDHFRITGWFGANVTLPCRYDAQTHGSLSFCWGRAQVPMSKCSGTILSSVDGAPLYTQSPRYRLLGSAGDGDVSLTILNAQWSDNGEYGCRVEIPGWFNDHKVNMWLVIEEEPVRDEIISTAQGREETSEESPLVAEIQFNGVFTFENFLGVRNLCRLAVVFVLTTVTILLFALRRGFLQRRRAEHISTSAAGNIYDSIPEPWKTSSPRFYKVSA